jgi:hypothetical protein
LPMDYCGVTGLSEPQTRDDKFIQQVIEEHFSEVKISKKPSSKKMIARAVKGGKEKGKIDEKHKTLLVNAYDSLPKHLSDKRKSELIAGRCVTGKWTHDPKIKTIIEPKHSEVITWRNVSEFIKRNRT